MEVGLNPGDFGLDGNPAPFQKGGGGLGQSPQLSAHGYCGRTAGWIKMALGMEVGLGPDHVVLDGEPAPLPQKGDRAPLQFPANFYCPQRHLAWRWVLVQATLC